MQLVSNLENNRRGDETKCILANPGVPYDDDFFKGLFVLICMCKTLISSVYSQNRVKVDHYCYLGFVLAACPCKSLRYV